MAVITSTSASRPLRPNSNRCRTPDRTLAEGDIVSIDVGVRLEGWCSDGAWTFPVGEVDAETASLLEVTEEALELMRDFFDCFLKGERNNGFLERAPVRLEVRSARDETHEVRGEAEWPLARTQYRKLYLESDGETLGTAAPQDRGELVYDAQRGELRLRHVFEADTELTGYMKLHLEVEVRSGNAGGTPPDDMTLFVGIDKRRADGKRVPFYGSVGNHHDMVARGLLCVSRRALDEASSTEWEPVLLHQRDEKILPGEVVPVEIAINPSSTFFARGEALELIISPREIVPSPPFVKDHSCNRGLHVIHVGAVPTPVLYFATHELQTGSGVMVTGSHNPANYNGLKIMLGGETLSGEAIQKLYQRIQTGDFASGRGSQSTEDVRRAYLDRIVGDIAVAAPLKVVVDAGNGIAVNI